MKYCTTTEMIKQFYKREDHPYQLYEKKILAIVKPDDTLLDAGCGRSAPILKKFVGKAARLIGVDLEENEGDLPSIDYVNANISSMGAIPSQSVNLVISRAVLEHIPEPDKVFKEINRILVPNGRFITLVPNFYDYGSLISMLIPNKFHAAIVNKVEGRNVNDTFPAYYKVNTYSAMRKLAKEYNFEIVSFDYLGQYPNYFMFSRILFLLGTLYDKTICKFEALGFLRAWLLVVIEKKND